MKIASIMPPEVDGSYQGWTPCMNWCSEQCEGYWRFVGEGVFEFHLDSDYLMFMLKWQ